MIDVFQFSNMYSVRPVIARVAADEVLQRECAAYVTRPGYPLVDYPKLLHLFSTLRPGKTVNDWIEEQNVDELGVDPRRFVTFGVIKGFLRRVHRYRCSAHPSRRAGARRGAPASCSPILQGELPLRESAR